MAADELPPGSQSLTSEFTKQRNAFDFTDRLPDPEGERAYSDYCPHTGWPVELYSSPGFEKKYVDNLYIQRAECAYKLMALGSAKRGVFAQLREPVPGTRGHDIGALCGKALGGSTVKTKTVPLHNAGRSG